MRTNKKLFPYPIINNDLNRSTFTKSTFSLECQDIEQTNQDCILKGVHYILDNDAIVEMIKKNKVKVYCVIECSSSLYRKEFEITSEPMNIKIPIYDIKDNVVVSSFAVIMSKIVDFKDDDFIEDYSGYSFTLDKYDIIAADDGFSFKVDYEEESDNKLSSIFKVIKQSDEDLLVKITPSHKKIFIYVPETQFNHYDNLKNNESVKTAFFSMLIIPALIIAIEHIKSNLSENKNLDDLALEYSWIKSLKQRYKVVFSKELSEDEFKEMNSLEVSQVLVNYPIVDGIESIYDLSFKKMGDEYDD